MQTHIISLVIALLGVLYSGSSVWGQEMNVPPTAEKPQTARVAEVPLPKVELTFTALGPGHWIGKRFSNIIAPDKIQRIILIGGHGPQFGKEGFAVQKAREQGDNEAFNVAYQVEEQAAYDSLTAEVVASTEKATEWGLGANEHTLAELMVLTTDDQLFRIEIVKGMYGNDSGALLIYGQGTSARIRINHSKFVESRD